MDLKLIWLQPKFAKEYSGQVVSTQYSADEFGTDTTKLWLTLTPNLINLVLNY